MREASQVHAMRIALQRRPALVLVLVLGGIGVLGLALAFVASVGDPGDPWADISSAGVTVAVVSVVGAVVTATFRFLDRRRAHDDQLRRIFHEILANYNKVKAVRRSLKALGVSSVGRDYRLNDHQAKHLWEQMSELNAAQLSLEAIGRELKHSDLSEHPKKIITSELRKVEDYLNKQVIEKWENAGGRIWGGEEPGRVDALDLQAFVAGRRHGDFEMKVSTRLDHIALVLQNQLFGHPSLDLIETWYCQRLQELVEVRERGARSTHSDVAT